MEYGGTIAGARERMRARERELRSVVEGDVAISPHAGNAKGNVGMRFSLKFPRFGSLKALSSLTPFLSYEYNCRFLPRADKGASVGNRRPRRCSRNSPF